MSTTLVIDPLIVKTLLFSFLQTLEEPRRNILDDRNQHHLRTKSRTLTTTTSAASTSSSEDGTTAGTASTEGDGSNKKTVPITYIEADGTEKQVEAEIGKNLMDVAHANNVELEGS